MKRAARFKLGSVVFDKRRKTWNFLQWVDGKRRSQRIGTLQEFPTKGAAKRAAAQIVRQPQAQEATTKEILVLSKLVDRYRSEKMPLRYSTRRSYEAWIKNYIIPKWGSCALTDLRARPVELWLQSLELAPRSKTGIRMMLNLLWDYAMWCGDVTLQRNPMELVTVKDASKRTHKARSLTVEEFQRLLAELQEPFHTIALVSVCFRSTRQ